MADTVEDVNFLCMNFVSAGGGRIQKDVATYIFESLLNM
jgi:hypothetical protein